MDVEATAAAHSPPEATLLFDKAEPGITKRRLLPPRKSCAWCCSHRCDQWGTCRRCGDRTHLWSDVQGNVCDPCLDHYNDESPALWTQGSEPAMEQVD